MAIIITGIVFTVPLTGIITTHLRSTARIKQETIQKEIELEKVKQQNFLIETEKMKVELEQMKLSYTTDVDQLLEQGQTRETKL